MHNTGDMYDSYLLQLWGVLRDDKRTWLAALQSTATGDRRSFPTVDALLAFLQAQFGECRPTADAEPQCAGQDDLV